MARIFPCFDMLSMSRSLPPISPGPVPKKGEYSQVESTPGPRSCAWIQALRLVHFWQSYGYFPELIFLARVGFKIWPFYPLNGLQSKLLFLQYCRAVSPLLNVPTRTHAHEHL